MSNQEVIVTTQEPANPFAPRGLAGHVSAGAVAIEQERAIAEAQKLGLAEADPSADIDGHDAAAKLSILAYRAEQSGLDVGTILENPE